MENKSLKEMAEDNRRAIQNQARRIESLESKMTILNPFARRPESIRWRVLETFVRMRTSETARDDTWTGIQVDKDLIEESNMTAHNGCITADVVIVRDDLSRGEILDTMKYRKVFAEIYGISVDDADKYTRHRKLVDILDMRATLRMDKYYPGRGKGYTRQSHIPMAGYASSASRERLDKCDSVYRQVGQTSTPYPGRVRCSNKSQAKDQRRSTKDCIDGGRLS